MGIVGRVRASKRQFDFLQTTARMIRDQAADATFFVIGEVRDRDYQRRIEQFATDNRLGERVIFTGRREDMPEVLSSLDVLVTLSGGSVMMEAMACGTPVISAGFTRREDSTIVQDMRTGLLVPPGQEGEFDRALMRLIEDPVLRHEMGQAGRQHCEANYCHQQMAAATETLYDRLLDAPTASTLH